MGDCFATERLILRPWRDADAEECFRYARDPLVGLPCGWMPHKDVDESREVIRGVLSAPGTYAIVLKETGLPVGCVSLITRKGQSSDEAEPGFWLGVPRWGQGIVPEASERLIRHGFEDLGLERVICGYFDGNEKSRRVSEKLGFTYFKTLKDVCIRRIGETKDILYGRLTKEDWERERRIRHVSLMLPVRGGMILLGMKKRGFGAGKINGAGGKAEPGESFAKAAVRECLEETGVAVRDPRDMGTVVYRDLYYRDGPETVIMHVFVSRDFEGEPAESDELAPRWFPLDEIPYENMWDDCAHWLPEVLKGRRVDAYFHYNEDDVFTGYSVDALPE